MFCLPKTAWPPTFEVRLPDGPLKAIGEYDIEIALHHDVVAPIKIVVTPEA